jgi:acyl carrier protein
MHNITVIVDELLAQLAAARDVSDDAPPNEIIVSSLDQMRFLVAVEERLDTVLEVGEVFPFDLTSRAHLVRSVTELVAEAAA